MKKYLSLFGSLGLALAVTSFTVSSNKGLLGKPLGKQVPNCFNSSHFSSCNGSSLPAYNSATGNPYTIPVGSQPCTSTISGGFDVISGNCPAGTANFCCFTVSTSGCTSGCVYVTELWYKS